MDSETLDLVTAGCLGTCWYGKYHYIEPWAGCGYDCAYCYARSRSPVTNMLAELGTVFARPSALKGDRLLEELAARVKAENVQIAKLSRYTDVLTPTMQERGTSLEVLKTLINSGVQRIIITTKGVPDHRIIEFMSAHKEKFSYNFVAKPETAFKLEGNIPPLPERLAAARQVSDRGIKVTVHVDPIVPGLEDEPDVFRDFLQTLKKNGLNRVMFSYLLLNQEIVDTIKQRFSGEFAARLIELYETEPKQVLPGQAETCVLEYKADLKRQSVEQIFEMLSSAGFEYVLCSLKSGKGGSKLKKENCRICDGTFYA
jgi:DNA repair photolyase